ncbi:MAG: hypothetical protein IIA67_11385 [Planctomycetes bacterium]|nr:hypothetical protein [Planctomycetota bacterium]
MSSLNRLNDDDYVTPQAYNELVAALEPLLNTTVASPLQMQRHGGGVHWSLAALPEFRLFELQADLAIGTTDAVTDDVPSALARHVHYRRSSNTYSETTHLDDVTVYDVGVMRDAGGIPIKTPSVGEGDRVWATFNAQSGRWEICPPRPLIRFELNSTLVIGGSASVTELLYNGSVWLPAGANLVVNDALNMFASAPPCRGIAGYWSDSKLWEIIQLDPTCGAGGGSSSSSSAPP